MKKILSIMIIAVFTLSFIVVFAANSDVTVKVDGNTVTFPDAKPFIDTKSNRTMVPIRFIAEEMGCTVGWSDQLRVVYINKGETNIELKIGNTKAILNGTIIDLDTEAIIKSDRTFVPLRFVSEALGADVKWDPSAKTVIITTKKADPAITPTPSTKPTQVINGYTIPANPIIIIHDISGRPNVDIEVEIDVTKPLQPQYESFKETISSKFNDAFVNELLAYIKLKENKNYNLEYKEFKAPNGQVVSISGPWKDQFILITIWKGAM